MWSGRRRKSKGASPSVAAARHRLKRKNIHMMITRARVQGATAAFRQSPEIRSSASPVVLDNVTRRATLLSPSPLRLSFAKVCRVHSPEIPKISPRARQSKSSRTRDPSKTTGIFCLHGTRRHPSLDRVWLVPS